MFARKVVEEGVVRVINLPEPVGLVKSEFSLFSLTRTHAHRTYTPTKVFSGLKPSLTVLWGLSWRRDLITGVCDDVVCPLSLYGLPLFDGCIYACIMFIYIYIVPGKLNLKTIITLYQVYSSWSYKPVDPVNYKV